MKTTTIIIAAFLSFQVSVLFAAGNKTTSLVNEREFYCPTCITAPEAPKEATFEDDATETDVATLAPVTPGEADFSDLVFETRIDLTSLAPATPTAADFTDDSNQQVDFKS